MRINKKIHIVNKDNDIKYRGFLSYRYMRIIGWVAMVVAQIAVILGIMARRWPSTHNLILLQNASDTLSIIGQLAIPLFLVANFALIFSARNNIKKLVLTHLFLAVIIYAIYLLVYYRYILDVVTYASPQSRSIVDEVLTILLQNYLTFNVFIDLFMCSSLYFFMVYRPTKFFVGKKLTIFRCFTILPILYEIACIILKGLSVGQGAIGMQVIVLPVAILPIMTSKPIVTFLAFLTILIFMKYRQTLYLKRGGTLEQYEDFVQTNTNSFHFSVLVAIIFAVAALLDYAVSSILYKVYESQFAQYLIDNPAKAYKAYQSWIKGWGLGKGFALIFASPLMLLFSYTKQHSDNSKKFDILIPLIGIAFCVLVYLEGFRDIIIYR